jgi:hypothetical protein
MKVKQEILHRIDSKVRMRIAMSLGTLEQNIYLAIRRNAPNGRLTKMDFLLAVKRELGVSVEDILEAERVEKV